MLGLMTQISENRWPLETKSVKQLGLGEQITCNNKKNIETQNNHWSTCKCLHRPWRTTTCLTGRSWDTSPGCPPSSNRTRTHIFCRTHSVLFLQRTGGSWSIIVMKLSLGLTFPYDEHLEDIGNLAMNAHLPKTVSNLELCSAGHKIW